MRTPKKAVANKYIDPENHYSKKKAPPKIAVVMKLDQETIDILDDKCEDEGVPRNQYLWIALEHYWACFKE